MEKRKIEISTGIIFRTIFILLAVYFLYSVRDIIALLFISVIIVSAIEPAVNLLKRKKIPRSLSVLGIYLILFLAIGFAVSFLIPPIITQFEAFTSSYPEYVHKLDLSLTPLRNFFQISNIDLSIEQIFRELARDSPDFQLIFSRQR
jgi:predicted PurR-regulated permease PerM